MHQIEEKEMLRLKNHFDKLIKFGDRAAQINGSVHSSVLQWLGSPFTRNISSCVT